MAGEVLAPAIRTVEVSKTFGSTRAVAHASITVEARTLVALLGPSGSGKTTLLRLIAGFEVPDAGTIEIGGRMVAGPGVWEEPERRRVGMVFQDGALFPHLTVARNVAFGATSPQRVGECLELVGLADRAKSYPHELSGGERQRVALARALATDPAVILLDEPFASLDATLRVTLREQVAAILRDAGASALLVTHDQQEALSLADELVVMRQGTIEQTGSPRHVYEHPASRWTAEFLGAADVLAGTASGGIVECELGRFPADPALHGAVEVVVRPEHVVLAPAGDATPNGCACSALVVERSFYGHDQLVQLRLDSGLLVRSRVPGSAPWQRGDRVQLWVAGPVTVVEPSSN